MKHVLRFILVVFAIAVYSCGSNSKKQIIDSTTKKTNSQIAVFQTKNPTSAKDQQIHTNLIFPKFTIKLHDFCVYGGNDGTNKLDYNGDSSKVSVDIDKNKIWNLTAKADALPLPLPGQLYFYTNVIEIIPEDKTDSFKISYSLPAYIVEYNNDKGNVLEVMNAYKPLKDSLNYFFRIPGSAYDNSNISDVKKSLRLKDTAIKDKASNGRIYSSKLVVYKNKACRMGSEGRVYLKIERFSGNKLIDTKFLIIAPFESEDAD